MYICNITDILWEQNESSQVIVLLTYLPLSITFPRILFSVTFCTFHIIVSVYLCFTPSPYLNIAPFPVSEKKIFLFSLATYLGDIQHKKNHPKNLTCSRRRIATVEFISLTSLITRGQSRSKNHEMKPAVEIRRWYMIYYNSWMFVYTDINST